MPAPTNDPDELLRWIDSQYRDRIIAKIAGGVRVTLPGSQSANTRRVAEEHYGHFLERVLVPRVVQCLQRAETEAVQSHYLCGVAFVIGLEAGRRELSFMSTLSVDDTMPDNRDPTEGSGACAQADHQKADAAFLLLPARQRRIFRQVMLQRRSPQSVANALARENPNCLLTSHDVERLVTQARLTLRASLHGGTL